MSLPDVHVNDPHVNAHNDERHVMNTLLDLTNTGRLSDTALTATYGTVVTHGSTAGTARPSGATQVLWKGTVAPTNGADDDVWLNTSTGDEQVQVSGSFIALNKANNDATYATQAQANAAIGLAVVLGA